MTNASQLIEEFKSRTPLPPLCPKTIWRSELSQKIKAMSGEELTGQVNASQLSIHTTRSGLLLWNDDLNASHTLSQDIPETIGSYWHGVMHRREGDFSNSKYWFRNVGRYHLFDDLFAQGIELCPALKDWKVWDPYRFIDEVESVVERGEEDSPYGEQLKKLQVLEIALLLKDSRKQ